MSLDDFEDNPPLEPVSVPPEPLEPFFEPVEADTEPPPPDFAAQVIDALMPRFDAIDLGVGKALNLVTNAADQVDRLADKFMQLSADFDALAKEFARFEHAVLDGYDRLGARVVRLEEWKREHTGEEDDGSLTAAAIALKSHPPGG